MHLSSAVPTSLLVSHQRALSKASTPFKFLFSFLFALCHSLSSARRWQIGKIHSLYQVFPSTASARLLACLTIALWWLPLQLMRRTMFSLSFPTLGRFRTRARHLHLPLTQSPPLKPNLAHPKLADSQQRGLCSSLPQRNLHRRNSHGHNHHNRRREVHPNNPLLHLRTKGPQSPHLHRLSQVRRTPPPRDSGGLL